MMFKRVFFSFVILSVGMAAHGWAAAAANPGFFDRGVELYQAGRFSDAVESFDQAIRKKDHSKEAQEYMDRIRKETVERIRNRALTGVNKANWQSKYYFMNTVDGRIRVGISIQELFERESAHFRPGAVEALTKLAQDLGRADAVRVEIELISELRQDTTPDPLLIAQQSAALFSYLTLAASGHLPRF